MTQPKTATALGLGVMMLAATAAAEPADSTGKRLEAGAFIGGNYLGSDVELGGSYFDDQVPGSAFLLGLRGGYLIAPALAPSSPANPGLAIELEAKLALSSTAGTDQAMRDSYFAPVLGWRAHAVLTMWHQCRFRPFALAGIGGETLFTSSPFSRSVDTDAALHWGLGAMYQLGPRYGLRGDLRHGITAGRDDLVSSTVEVHLGMYYSFDTGEARKPAPVVVMEPIEAPEPAKPADSDGDGRLDEADRCPQQAELVNGIDDEDGCPDEDNDSDGRLGSRDACPDVAEDIDGYEDEDGCLDADNDGDGRSDVIDACPQEAETLNGFDDEDGCPDQVPPQVAEYTGVIAGIQFRGNSARIERTSFARLDRAAAILSAYPSVRLRISGHTDDRGTAGKNLLLSRTRAEAVKRHLIDKGVDASRLEAVGHGSQQPIADNKTGAGRAKNRRIEFELLPGPAQMPEPGALPESPAPADGAAPPDGPAQP